MEVVLGTGAFVVLVPWAAMVVAAMAEAEVVVVKVAPAVAVKAVAAETEEKAMVGAREVRMAGD